MKSNTPSRWKSRCAVGRSKIANDAPRRLFELPNRTMPEIVYSPGPVGVTTRIYWPTARSWSVDVPASITTSCGPAGAAPSTSVKAELFGDHEKWQGPYVWIAAISEVVAIVAGLVAVSREFRSAPAREHSTVAG